MSSKLDPIDVLAELLIVQRLTDAGFSVVPTEPPPVSDDVLLAGMQEVRRG